MDVLFISFVYGCLFIVIALFIILHKRIASEKKKQSTTSTVSLSPFTFNVDASLSTIGAPSDATTDEDDVRAIDIPSSQQYDEQNIDNCAYRETNSNPNSTTRVHISSPKVSEQKDVRIATHNNWNCIICEFSNTETKTECDLCGTRKSIYKLWRSDRKEGGEKEKNQKEQQEDQTQGQCQAQGRKMKIHPIVSPQSKRNVPAYYRMNSRQLGAFRRKEWTRESTNNGKSYWKRHTLGTYRHQEEDEQQEQSKREEPRLSNGFIIHCKNNNNTWREPVQRRSSTVCATIKEDIRSKATKETIPLNQEDNDLDPNPYVRLTIAEYQDDHIDVPPPLIEPFCNYDASEISTISKMPFSFKYQYFLTEVSKFKLNKEEHGYLIFDIHRETLIQESLGYLVNCDIKDLHLPVSINFIDEAGIDAGALKREWYTLVSEMMFQPEVGLFKPCEGEGDGCEYLINPHSRDVIGSDDVHCYHAIGRFLGMALCDGMCLSKLKLCIPMLKYIIGMPMSFSDLQFIDSELYQNLKWLKTYAMQSVDVHESEDPIAELQLDFTVTEVNPMSGKACVIPLVPNGEHLFVTSENVDQFIQHKLRYYLFDRIKMQLHSLLQGIYEIVPRELLHLFDYQELALIFSGVPTLDIDDWYANTQVSRDLVDSPILGWFWDMVYDLSPSQQAKLLHWSTGSYSIPVNGFAALSSYDSRVCLFTLQLVDYNPIIPFPIAHACFNRIDIPLYASEEELRQYFEIILSMDTTGFSKE